MKKILLTLMCATALVVSANANAKDKKDFPNGEPPRHERMADKLARDLNLTAEQKTQADKIRKDGREKVKPLMEKMKKIHEEMDKLREDNMKEFEKILTPEQQEKFAQIKAEMKKHDMRRKGHKGPKGPRPGHGMMKPEPHPGMHPDMHSDFTKPDADAKPEKK